jgi:hypothetical protein
MGHETTSFKDQEGSGREGCGKHGIVHVPRGIGASSGVTRKEAYHNIILSYGFHLRFEVIEMPSIPQVRAVLWPISVNVEDPIPSGIEMIERMKFERNDGSWSIGIPQRSGRSVARFLSRASTRLVAKETGHFAFTPKVAMFAPCKVNLLICQKAQNFRTGLEVL